MSAIPALLCGVSVLSAAPSDRDPDDTLSSRRSLPLPVSRAEVILPRPALQPVKSFVPTSAEPIDTLDTQVWYIKVILYKWCLNFANILPDC